LSDERDPLPEDRYYIHDLLGEGGMARVWRAWHYARQSWCAVKVLQERYSKEKLPRRRFVDEGHTVINLDHRNIIKGWELEDDIDRPFLVMEVADGGSLRDWVSRHGPMPPHMAVGVAIQICKGISAVHTKGVIHRDIKPHNILINRKGVCKVTDFGIARIRRPDGSDDVPDATTVQTSAQAVGTLGYMAPEQQSDPRRADVRTDVYGIGATLYDLLTDRRFTNLFMIKEDPELLEGIPELLRPLMIKAVAYHPEDRWPEVGALSYQLYQLRKDLPEDPPGTPHLIDGLTPEPQPPQGLGISLPSGELRLDDLEIPTTYIRKEVRVSPPPRPPPVPPVIEATARPMTPSQAPPVELPARRSPSPHDPSQPHPSQPHPSQPHPSQAHTLRESGSGSSSRDSGGRYSRSGSSRSPRLTMPTFVTEHDRPGAARAGFVMLGALAGTVLLLLCLVASLGYVWSARWAASSAHEDLEHAINKMLSQHENVVRLGADRSKLDELQNRVANAPDGALLREVDGYIQTLETLIGPEPPPDLARPHRESDDALEKLKQAREDYGEALELWGDRASGMPGALTVWVRLAPAPPPLLLPSLPPEG
jgi:serine/threonine protein kinase